MWRRLYLSFPDSEHARQAADELLHDGIQLEQMHAMSREGGSLPGLPESSEAQMRDSVWSLEQFYWKGNLALFGVALLGFIVALYSGAVVWAGLTAFVMLATFLGGNYFASNVPHAHLNQMHEAMQHGEVVLLVDLPKEQVSSVDHKIARHHPEASGHVVGWTIRGVGI